LEAAGFEIIPVRFPLAAVWHLVCVSPSTLLLVSVVRGDTWPDVGLGVAYSLPPAWPAWTRRLIHRSTEEAPLPLRMSL
jgi:hypothetical protein